MNHIFGAFLGLYLPTLIFSISAGKLDSIIPNKQNIQSAKNHVVERTQMVMENLPLEDVESSIIQFVDELKENVQELRKTIPQIVKGVQK